jgi:hypothetical protein
MKKVILMLGMLVILSGCNAKEKEKKKEEPKAIEVKDEEIVGLKTVGGLEIRTTSLTLYEGDCNITTQIKNATDAPFEIKDYNILVTFLVNGEEITVTISNELNKTLVAGAEETLNNYFITSYDEISAVNYRVNTNQNAE